MKHAILSEDVSFKYLNTETSFLKDINLDIKKGECVLICGASGSGKSTFSRLVNGISPDYIEGTFSGKLSTMGLNTGESTIEEYVPIVGSVFQNPKTQHFTVNSTSELAFPMENMGEEPEKIINTIQNKAAAFNISHLLDRNMFEISGGEKQQIAFVAANMTEPDVLVLDEVTSNLDQEAITRISEMVAYLKNKGMTILILEHRLAWTKGIVDRYVLFNEGQIKKEWSKEAFYELSNEELHQYGLRSMDLTEHRTLINEKLVDIKDIADTGILKTQHLSVGYHNQTVLEGLNIGFEQGDIVGVLGPNGTGKSTLANTLTGLQQPLKGKILWNNNEIHSNDLIKKSYLVMQDMNYQLFSDSVEDEILLGAKHPEHLENLLEALNLTQFRERHPMSLSEGQKQRVVIASAVLSGKELIVFDEPTSGLDYENMEKFGLLLNKLKKSNAVIIVITHDEELASKWCDKIINLNKVK